ncbi:MAG: cell division protein FtsZ [Nitrososphaerota archaeon]
MAFQFSQQTLVIGLGGAGSKLAIDAHKNLDADCLLISHDKHDLKHDCSTISVNTGSIVNPSTYLIRGYADKVSSDIKSKISNYSSIVLVANLAGKAGSAIAPIVSHICKESGKDMISFAIMPFKFEKDRIFNAGVSLKRLREDSTCIVIDNDALLDCNPDLTQKACYEIANSAMLHVINSLKSSSLSDGTSILSTSKTGDIEVSLRESIKMLYEDAPPSSVKRSILYVLGNDVTVGTLNSITNISSKVFGDDTTQVGVSASSSENSNVIMLSTVQGDTRFDRYDPLGVIPSDHVLDWQHPDCSISCELNLYQLE